MYCNILYKQPIPRMSTKNAVEKDTALAHKYQQKTDKQHILDNPDTYIGSVEKVDADLWILNETGDKIVEKNIHYIPALFKLFDEGIVNCRDHVIRMQQAVNMKTQHLFLTLIFRFKMTEQLS